MTDFSSLFVAGVPILGGGVPATFGTSYFVDSDNGSDSFDGLSMKVNGGSGPFETYLKAYNTVTDNNHDYIFMSGISGHTVTTTIDWTKNLVHTVGLPISSRLMGQRSRVEMDDTATGTGVAIVQNTGKGNSWTNIKFRSTDDQANSIYAFADGGEFTEMNFCSFEKDEDLSVSGAAELLCNADSPIYRSCTFGNGIYTIAAARQNILFTRETVGVKVARDVHFEDCIFMSRCNDSAFVNVRATTNDIERLALFKDCTFLAVKTSPASQADVFGIASALTDARIILQGSTIVDNIGEVASVAGVFSNFAVPNEAGPLSTAVT